MRLIKGLCIALLGVAALFICIGLILPGAVHVERTALIDAPPGRIFPYVNDLHKFNAWSPWAARDPATTFAFTGPEQGAGAQMSWDSEKHGRGQQHIIASVPDEHVVASLDFGAMGTAQASFLLLPDGGATRITWTLDTDLPYNPLARWFGLVCPSLIGADYEEGLARLKALIEKGTV
jgi:uncharacterized protein YndB with AHSA1/START domain